MNFAAALKILVMTTPYLLLLLGVYLLVGIGIGVCLAILVLLSKVFGGAGGLIFLIGLGVIGGLLLLVRNYVIYMIKAGHIAVVTELIRKGKLPDGVNQVEYGRKAASSIFTTVSVLFVVDRLIKGILRALNRTVVRIAEILPIPGLDAAAKIINSIIRFAVTYVDESILSYIFSRPEQEVFESSRKGVILYAQNWKPILKTAVGLALIDLLAFVALVAVLLLPFAPLALAAKSGGWKFFWFAMAITLAYCLKLALVRPFSMIAMIITYNKAVEGQVPNPQWEAHLESVSAKFRQLKEKARAAVSGAGSPVPAATSRVQS
jgi:hypothetical protein